MTISRRSSATLAASAVLIAAAAVLAAIGATEPKPAPEGAQPATGAAPAPDKEAPEMKDEGKGPRVTASGLSIEDLKVGEGPACPPGGAA